MLYDDGELQHHEAHCFPVRRRAQAIAIGITLSVDYTPKIAEEVDEKIAPILIAYEHKTGPI